MDITRVYRVRVSSVLFLNGKNQREKNREISSYERGGKKKHVGEDEETQR